MDSKEFNFLINHTAALPMIDLPAPPQKPYFGKNDPKSVRQALNLNKVTNDLFPLIRSGVRAWPYLITAYKFKQSKSKKEILPSLRKMEAIQKKSRSKVRKKYGPKSEGTFRNHLSFINVLIEARKQKEVEDLVKFLARQNFDGDHNFLVKHSPKWKELIISALGKEASKLLTHFHETSTQTKKNIPNTITRILKMETKNLGILHAAFCYSFLRVIYGEKYNKKIQKSPNHDLWWPLLENVLLKNILINYEINTSMLKSYLDASKNGPHLINIQKKLTKIDRDVLTGAKFNIFFDLIVQPIPGGQNE